MGTSNDRFDRSGAQDHAQPPAGVARKRGRRRLRHRPPPGASPGTLVTDPDAPRPQLHVIAYGPDGLEESDISRADEARGYLKRWPVVWINVDGLGDVQVIRELGELFGLHRLSLEDVVNVYQRPKMEPYGDYLFAVTRMVHGARPLDTEQISLFLGAGYVLTFQERPGDSFEPVRERLRRASGQIRQRGPDYLAYALLDAALDAYFPVLEGYGERLDDLQEAAMSDPGPEVIARIHEAKRDLITLRRAVWPQRDMINALSRDGGAFVDEATKTYLRDAYDHCIQLVDLTETYRELAGGLTDIYMSSATARTNEIMKVLTMIATIFIPLGFVASVYGMNFDPQASPWNMPELGWAFGYPYALTIMLAVAGGFLWYFRRKGWMRRFDRSAPRRAP